MVMNKFKENSELDEVEYYITGGEIDGVFEMHEEREDREVDDNYSDSNSGISHCSRHQGVQSTYLYI